MSLSEWLMYSLRHKLARSCWVYEVLHVRYAGSALDLMAITNVTWQQRNSKYLPMDP